MNLSSDAVAQAAALPLSCLLPPPVLAHRSVVIVAACGRDLVWPQERIASALLKRIGGRPVHLLLHGGARGADRAIGRAADQLGWRVQSLAADWRRYGRSAGPIRNRLLLQQALVEAQAHTSPVLNASVLVMEVPPPFSPKPLAAPFLQSLFPSHIPMAVLTVPAEPLSPSLPQTAGPSCSLQRSGSLWQLGIEARKLTTAIGLLAQQLEADDEDARSQSLAKLEAALLVDRAPARPGRLPAAAG